MSACFAERNGDRNQHRGIGWVNSKVRFVDITDGTRNTFMFMKKIRLGEPELA